MTFTEAAIEVLRREGKPLHFRKITEIAVRENLLDHVGKIPEEVMADQIGHDLLGDLADVVEQVLPDGDLGDLPEVERLPLAPQHLDGAFGESHGFP